MDLPLEVHRKGVGIIFHCNTQRTHDIPKNNWHVSSIKSVTAISPFRPPTPSKTPRNLMQSDANKTDVIAKSRGGM